MEYYTKKDLKKLGWSDCMIKEWFPNPHEEYYWYCSYKRVRYIFPKNDIDAIMKSKEFRDRRQKYLERKSGATKRMKTLVKKLAIQMKEFAETAPIEHLTPQELISRIQEANDSAVIVTTENREVVVAFICNNLTRYQDGIQMMKGKVGKKQVLPLFQNIIFRKIGEVYPIYADVCQRYMKPVKRAIERMVEYAD